VTQAESRWWQAFPVPIICQVMERSQPCHGTDDPGL
jgi:hypothetical protein